VPTGCTGPMMQLSQERRGIYKTTEYLDVDRVILTYEMPLAEVVMDFYDKIKSLSSGYGSFNYDLIGYKTSKLVKLDILINDSVCDAFRWDHCLAPLLRFFLCRTRLSKNAFSGSRFSCQPDFDYEIILAFEKAIRYLLKPFSTAFSCLLSHFSCLSRFILLH